MLVPSILTRLEQLSILPPLSVSPAPSVFRKAPTQSPTNPGRPARCARLGAALPPTPACKSLAPNTSRIVSAATGGTPTFVNRRFSRPTHKTQQIQSTHAATPNLSIPPGYALTRCAAAHVSSALLATHPHDALSSFFSPSSELFRPSQNPISRLFINFQTLPAKHRGAYPAFPYLITSLRPYLSIRRPQLRARLHTDHGPRYTVHVLPSHCAPPRKVPKSLYCLLRNTRFPRPAPGKQLRFRWCLTVKRTLGTATPHRRSWSPIGPRFTLPALTQEGSLKGDRTRKKASVLRSPSERPAIGRSNDRPNCSKARSPHRAGKAGSVRMG